MQATFKTETHLHTSEVSKCGQISAAELVRMYRDAGYSTVFVSDHFQTNTLDTQGDIPWVEKIDNFLSGYLAAKAAGDELGINVILCAEFRLADTPNHFLGYGITRDFLLAYPEMHKLSAVEFSRIAHEAGVFIVHAHPFRDSQRAPMPDLADAIEVYNSNPRHENNTPMAEALAESTALPITAGSDTHRLEDVALSGVITDFEIKCTADYVRALRTGALTIIR